MNEKPEIDDVHVEILGLRSILVASLPDTLLTSTPQAPYTVEAVFTRRVNHAEEQALHCADALEYLSDSGYPNVRLAVKDRRLQIQHTTLEELRDGLGQTLAKLLADISVRVIRAEHLATLAAVRDNERELWRAKTIIEMAEAIDFSLPVNFEREPLMQSTNGDAAQIAGWADEGGKNSN